MTDPAADLLNKALNIVTGARRKSYGNPEDNFKVIADLWSVYLRRVGLDFTDPEQGLTPANVAALMALMKLARLAETPDHEDSWQDLAGYAACGWRCVAPRQEELTFPETRGTTHGELMQLHDAAEFGPGDVMLCTCEHLPASYSPNGVCGICGAEARKL